LNNGGIAEPLSALVDKVARHAHGDTDEATGVSVLLAQPDLKPTVSNCRAGMERTLLTKDRTLESTRLSFNGIDLNVQRGRVVFPIIDFDRSCVL
jgi:hypothetical protein